MYEHKVYWKCTGRTPRPTLHCSIQNKIIIPKLWCKYTIKINKFTPAGVLSAHLD